MSIASEITRIKNNIENAYTKAEEKGATIPDVKNSENLASCVESITAGGSGFAELPTYQVVDGVVSKQTGDITGMFDDVVSIENYALEHGYYKSTSITGLLSFPKLSFIKTGGLTYCFYNCTNITGVNFGSLDTVYADGLSYCFYKCTNITEANFESLGIINDIGLQNCFFGCTNLSKVNFDSLHTVMSGGLSQAFYNCTALKNISFPSLTRINSTSGWSQTFNNCSNLEEIHFRADMQSVVENLVGYSTKFGATNAIIYFDL